MSVYRSSILIANEWMKEHVKGLKKKEEIEAEPREARALKLPSGFPS